MRSLFNNEVFKGTINKHFGEIEDPRVERTQAHYLVDIIVIVLFVVISGADSLVGIETYGRAKEEWLKHFLELRNGIPLSSTGTKVEEPGQSQKSVKKDSVLSSRQPRYSHFQEDRQVV